MDKRERILDALLEALIENGDGGCSVADLAKRAGIARGGMYYYFKSKDDAMDALIDRELSGIAAYCRGLLAGCGGGALFKLALLLINFQKKRETSPGCKYIRNTSSYGKLMAKTLASLSGLAAAVIEEGAAEGVFTCGSPLEYAEILSASVILLLEPGAFEWTAEERRQKLTALAKLMEKGFDVREGAFMFLNQL